MEEEIKSVLITGICGRLGRRLARDLHRRMRVTGLDERPFVGKPKDVEHHQLPLLSNRVRDLFTPGRFQALVHLGTSHNPREAGAEHHRHNVVGIRSLLEEAERSGIKKVVLLSSANVYGPRPDNPQFLLESAPLLASGAFSEMRDLVEVDMLAQSFLWQHSHIDTVILRPTHILGTVHNAPSNYLRLAVVPTILGFDPMVQVIHQEDVVQALVLALRPRMRGIFNLAGPPPVALSQALKMLGRNTVSLPHSMAKWTIDGLFRVGVSSFPAPELDFIRHVCMVECTRAKEVLGFAPEYGLEETLGAVDEERWVA